MVKKYDPDITVHQMIETEDDRVEFLMGISQAMASRAGIRLNTKRLYAADGYAVQELLKVATTLYRASRADKFVEDDEDTEASSGSYRLQDIKGARSLASDITERGAKLHDLLKQEIEIRAERAKSIRFLDAISGNLENGSEQQYIEKALTDIIETTKDDAEKLKKQCGDLGADENALREKIKRKQNDLER